MANTVEEAKKALEEAQKLPIVTLEHFGGYKNLPTKIQESKTEAQMNEYLSDFVKPTGNCWFCKSMLIIDWSLVHGYAHCSECGVDVKVYHYFETKEGEKDRVRWERILQYHPKNYSTE